MWFSKKCKENYNNAVSFSGSEYLGISKTHDELLKQVSDLKTELKEIKQKEEKEKTEKQLQEMKDFISAGNKFTHAGIEYVCVDVCLNKEYISNSGYISISCYKDYPSIIAQPFETIGTEDRVNFKYSELPCLIEQNKQAEQRR